MTRIELPGGVLAWSVNTYALVKQVLGDPQRFGKDPKNWSAYVNGEIPADWPMIGWVVMDNMTTNDDGDHARGGAQVPGLRCREDPLPQPPYVLLGLAPVH